MKRNRYKPKCFFITPLGDTNSDVRSKTEEIIRCAISPIVKDKLKYNLILPHRICQSGSMISQIFSNIVDDELVIANLTGLNANVVYEMAARHATGKPLIIIAQNGTKIPFDFFAERTIMYDHSPNGFQDLQENLNKFIISAQEMNIASNPVYDSITSSGAKHVGDANKIASAYRLILAKLDAVELNTINLYTNKALMDFHGISPHFGAIIHIDVINTPDTIISKIISKITVYFIRNGVQVAVIIDKKNNYLKIVNGNYEKIMRVIIPAIEVEFGMEKLSYDFYEE